MTQSDLPELPFSVPKSVMSKAAKVRLAIFDVDGVLTDGRLHYGPQGEELKVFHALDGHGLKMLQAAGIEVAVITARQSSALAKRLKDLSIKHVFMGAHDKVACFTELTNTLAIEPQHCAFTGDDVVDLGVMSSCGLSFSVANGHFLVHHFADWVSPFTGGGGAVRSICDVLLYSQNTYPLGKSSTQ